MDGYLFLPSREKPRDVKMLKAKKAIRFLRTSGKAVPDSNGIDGLVTRPLLPK